MRINVCYEALERGRKIYGPKTILLVILSGISMYMTFPYLGSWDYIWNFTTGLEKIMLIFEASTIVGVFWFSAIGMQAVKSYADTVKRYPEEMTELTPEMVTQLRKFEDNIASIDNDMNNLNLTSIIILLIVFFTYV